MGDIDILLAWDVSRLTRNNELNKIESMVTPFGCQIRFVTIASEPGTFASEIETNVKESFSKEERKKLSTRTKLGMVTAIAKGIHCGRPVAIVLDTEVNTTPGVKLDGKRPTRILTMDEITEKSGDGMTVKEAAKIWGVAYTSLIRFLKVRGLFGLFDGVPKGGSTKRVGSSNITEQKEGGERHYQKGTLIVLCRTLLVLSGEGGGPVNMQMTIPAFVSDQNLDRLQRRILVFIGNNPGSTIEDIEENFCSLDARTVRRSVKHLSSKGLILSKGFRNGRYGDFCDVLYAAGGWQKVLG